MKIHPVKVIAELPLCAADTKTPSQTSYLNISAATPEAAGLVACDAAEESHPSARIHAEVTTDTSGPAGTVYVTANGVSAR